MSKYKRVLLKLSGEQLAGKFEVGIDPEIASWLAEEVMKVHKAGCQVVLVVGGGNMVRGAEVAKHGIKRVTADQMGMLSGLINSMALTDIFEAHNIPTRCLSNIYAEQVAESFAHRLVEKHLDRGRVVIVAGGIGRPYFTHDTAAVSLALELECEVVLKGTKVNGVYDKDPVLHKDAKPISHIRHQAAVEDVAIKVMDKAALGLALEHNMPIIIFDVLKKNNLVKVVRGDAVGTTIH